MKIRSTLLCIIALLSLTSTYLAANPTQQLRERVVRRLPIERNEPLSISDIKAKGKSISFDQTFLSDSDWLNGLTVGVKNKTDKTILFASIQLQFPLPAASALPTPIVDMSYGNGALVTRLDGGEASSKGIAPGQTVELRLSSDDLESLKELLSGRGYSTDLDKVDLRVGHVVFEDDTMWYAGTLMRRDPNGSSRWISVNIDKRR